MSKLSAQPDEALEHARPARRRAHPRRLRPLRRLPDRRAPPRSERARLDDPGPSRRLVPALQPEARGKGRGVVIAATATGWTGRPLGQVADTKSPEPTVGAGGDTVYPGARHIFMGEPESGKTIAVYAIALEESAADPWAGWRSSTSRWTELACRRFREMGATDQEAVVDRSSASHPTPRPGPARPTCSSGRDDMLFNPLLVVYDSWAGAFLRPRARRQQARNICSRLHRSPRSNGITTIVLDHVTKSREGRAHAGRSAPNASSASSTSHSASRSSTR